MTILLRAAALALIAAPLAALSACQTPPDAASVLASANGTGPEDAYVVSSIEQEYEIIRMLGLEMRGQALHMIDGTAYDVFDAVDPATQEAREVWFDISRFYGRGVF